MNHEGWFKLEFFFGCHCERAGKELEISFLSGVQLRDAPAGRFCFKGFNQDHPEKVFILEPLDRFMRRMDFLSHKVTTDL